MGGGLRMNIANGEAKFVLMEKICWYFPCCDFFKKGHGRDMDRVKG